MLVNLATLGRAARVARWEDITVLYLGAAYSHASFYCVTLFNLENHIIVS